MAEKVVEIQSAFFDLREELQNTKEENQQLKETIKSLNDVSEIEKDLELSPRGCYIRKSEKGQSPQPIYCAACWQNHRKLMPIVNTIEDIYQCCNCHTVIG